MLTFGSRSLPSFLRNFIAILNILFIFQTDFENDLNKVELTSLQCLTFLIMDMGSSIPI